MRRMVLNVVEAAGYVVGCVGVGLWSVPAGLVVFGAGVVAFCEVRA